jgi:rhamnose transport system permease protein
MKAMLRTWAWEATLVVLVLATAAWAASLSPFYLAADQILYSLQQTLAIAGLLAAGLMMIIVAGEIDISLPAILAMGTILFARMGEADLPLGVALPVVLVVGTAAGLINGLLVVGFGLPSLAVTLGMTSAYRAFALALGGQEGHADFPDSYLWLGSSSVLGIVPVSLLLLALAYALLGGVMHGTVFGRLLYMIGVNPVAMRFSGVRVGTVKVAAFAAAGAIAGLAALVYVGQFESARADNAADILLFVVAAVTLGGVDVFGGRGHVLGVLLSLLLLGTLKNGMGLANLPGPLQTLVIGAVLILSVAIPQLPRFRRHLRRTPDGFAVEKTFTGTPRPAVAQHLGREE